MQTRGVCSDFSLLIPNTPYSALGLKYEIFEQTSQDKCGNKAVDFVFKSTDVEPEVRLDMRGASVCCCTSGDQ